MALPLTYLRVPRDEDDDSDEEIMIKVVRIACDGEAQELDVPKFQSLTLPIHDTIFRDPEESAIPNISRFLGIPLAARRIPVDRYADMSLKNGEVASLFRNCNITADDLPPSASRIVLGFGASPVEWALEPGPVLLARTDGKLLHPLHAATITAFCIEHLDPAFEECLAMERTSERARSSSSASSSYRSNLRGIGPLSQVSASSVAVTAPLGSHPPFAPSIVPRPGSNQSGSSSAAMASREAVFEQRRTVLARATPAALADFFVEYKERRVLGRLDLYDLEEDELTEEQLEEKWRLGDEVDPKPEWANVPSPYEV